MIYKHVDFHRSEFTLKGILSGFTAEDIQRNLQNALPQATNRTLVVREIRTVEYRDQEPKHEIPL